MEAVTQRNRAVGLAASAGGLAAMTVILAALPRGFPYPILLLLHLEARAPSVLADILARRTHLQVRQAAEDDPLQAGTVYVAPPDWHLTVSPSLRVHLTQAPPLHFVRPSADVLFASIAEVYGAAGVGIICTGTGKDGADGLRALRDCGGLTLVQDQASSRHFGMPGEAIRKDAAQEVLPLDQIGPRLLALLAEEPITRTRPAA
jgi:two-component system chemotaxis response regulator CheB